MSPLKLHSRFRFSAMDLVELSYICWSPLTPLIIFSSGSHVAVEFIKQSHDCSYVKVWIFLMDNMDGDNGDNDNGGDGVRDNQSIMMLVSHVDGGIRR